MILASYLAEQSGFQLVGQCGSLVETEAFLAKHDVDAMFLDIKLSDGTGFDVVDRVDPVRAPLVIFVTAYDEHAVRAFEVSAVDYLLKPVSGDRFGAAVERLRSRLRSEEAAHARRTGFLDAIRAAQQIFHETAQPQRPPRYLGARTAEGVQVIPIATVRYLHVEGHYVTIHTTTGSHLVRGRLSDFEEQLDPDRFVRIHRSTIVNLDHVSSLTSWFRGDYLVRLHDGIELRLSRTFRMKLQRRLGPEWWGGAAR
jgi:two-component system LytT family response regulator